MQIQYSIEIRVDFADQDKKPEMRKAAAAAGRLLYATGCLLADGVEPTIAIFSDDFYSGHEEIKLLEDTVTKGMEEIATGEVQDSQVSDELMHAMNDSKGG